MISYRSAPLRGSIMVFSLDTGHYTETDIPIFGEKLIGLTFPSPSGPNSTLICDPYLISLNVHFENSLQECCTKVKWLMVCIIYVL